MHASSSVQTSSDNLPFSTESSLSSGETIATIIMRPQMHSAIRPVLTEFFTFDSHPLPPEGSLSFDETIARTIIPKSRKHARPPGSQSALSKRAVPYLPEQSRQIKSALLSASQHRNQHWFEMMLTKPAADYINLSTEQIPFIANTIHWHLHYSRPRLSGAPIAMDTNIIKRLLDLGARVNTLDEAEQRNSALWMALQQTNEKITKLLLEYGCDPNSSRALTTAAQNGSLNHLHILLQHGANPNSLQDGKYALSQACLRGDIPMTKLLLESGANMHARDAKGRTALLNACASGNLRLVKFLIAYGASLTGTLPDQDGNLPLHIAAQAGAEKINDFLLQSLEKADACRTNNQGQTACDIALCSPDAPAQIIHDFLSKGYTQFDNHKLISRMYLACASDDGCNQHKKIEYLFSHGIPEYIPDEEFNTLCLEATRRDDQHMLTLLNDFMAAKVSSPAEK